MDIIIIGGGAAGFMAAITCAEQNPSYRVIILERGQRVLEKVRVSGGGRCNVTNATYEPKELVKSYPRGGKELLGPFHKFAPGDTWQWFEKRGVPLKMEDDGRVFPVSDSSQSIIDCFLNAAHAAGVQIITGARVEAFEPQAEGRWKVELADGDDLFCDALMVATGSSLSIWAQLEKLGHTIVKPVPSLFTFNISDPRLDGLSGIAMPAVEVKIKDTKLKSRDNFLITHWGLSGFSVLKLSAWAARELADKNYEADIEVNFRPGYSVHDTNEDFTEWKPELIKKIVAANPFFNIPSRLWQRLVAASNIGPEQRWADMSKAQIAALSGQICAATFRSKGKTTFKEEFVTSGGVQLKEVEFKNFSSKLLPNLYFAGEVLDIDALTGGFNFQAAWTGGYLVGMGM